MTKQLLIIHKITKEKKSKIMKLQIKTKNEKGRKGKRKEKRKEEKNGVEWSGTWNGVSKEK